MSPRFLLVAGFGAAAVGATVVGGMLAIRLERSLNALLSFGNGVVPGVALLDLLPEALELGEAKIAHSLKLPQMKLTQPCARSWKPPERRLAETTC